MNNLNGEQKVNVGTELFQWLNEQTDLSNHQVDLVDGFVFMLHKINRHGSIRIVGKRQIHPRFWRSHDRTFGYELMNKKGSQKNAHLYQFYIDVAYTENLIYDTKNDVKITEDGIEFLDKKRDEQLNLLFTHIW